MLIEIWQGNDVKGNKVIETFYATSMRINHKDKFIQFPFGNEIYIFNFNEIEVFDTLHKVMVWVKD